MNCQYCGRERHFDGGCICRGESRMEIRVASLKEALIGLLGILIFVVCLAAMFAGIAVHSLPGIPLGVRIAMIVGGAGVITWMFSRS